MVDEQVNITPIRLLLTGGGTGGHLFPAIAAAQKLVDLAPGSEVMFVGTKRKMDKTSLASYSFATKSIHCYGLKGKSIPELLKALLVLPISCIEAALIILRFKPDVVLGVGGYVTGPVVFIARMLGKKTMIHEQNSVPGLANRKLGGLVDRVCLSLPDSGSLFPKGKTSFTGNPVRKEIVLQAEKMKSDSGDFVIAILGGSQGAHAVNMLAVDAFCSTELKEKKSLKIIHQTGANDSNFVNGKYDDAGVKAEVSPFFKDMAAIYEQADLVISRAGATTLSELAVMGKPAILFPYPTAADNHQEKNGEYYVQGGGAIMLNEKEITANELGLAISDFIENRGKLQAMSMSMKQLGFPKAAENIVEVCMGLLPNQLKHN